MAEARSGTDGRWNAKARSAAGTYYAAVQRTFNDRVGVCGRARSKQVRIATAAAAVVAPSASATTDSDGDGVPDAQDRCPQVAAQAAGGCPRVARRVTIAAQRHRVSGEIRALAEPLHRP